MSKTIVYDSLLVRALAAALAKRFAGARLRAIRFDSGARTVRLSFPRRALVWDLDPAGGGLWQEPERGPATGTILPRGTVVADVRAADDDRLLEWTLRAEQEGKPRMHHLWLELLPNRRNAILTGENDRVVGALSPVTPGDGTPATWSPPPPRPRTGAETRPDAAAFAAALRDLEPAARERALLSGFAWTSPLNAGAILGDDTEEPDDDALAASLDRYAALVDTDDPGVLEPGILDQPYPAPLPGRAFRRTADLLAAFEEVAPVHRTRTAGRDPAAVLGELERLRDGERSKIDRLRAEMSGAALEAERLRTEADLLLGRLHTVRRGMAEVTLEDWAGGTVTLKLDPSLEPAANANRLYDRARKRERAADRLPRLIARSRERLDRLETAIGRLTADPGAIDDVSGLIPPPARAKGKSRVAALLPYRTYRTSGGLEVRVGRGSKSNDELTLHHSSPDDIWLHARQVAGAHVVLRWGRRDENPPGRDIAEAASLAALHSRARTSATVPVDWTRRKYVRKPRKSPPGRVVVERARTIFVEPDAGLEERLRQE